MLTISLSPQAASRAEIPITRKRRFIRHSPVRFPIHVKIGAKVIHHGRYVTFQLAEVAVP
ncbi:MAG: hypothetical protein CMM10_01675 [Rhodospirillaceae bacterium]|nr:hypothetical protein [Rhodospirillaceae bacterium]